MAARMSIAALVLAIGAAHAQEGRDRSPAVADLQKALGPLASAVEQSARIRGPVAGDLGQYVARLADGREIGLFVREYRFPIEATPPIWINVIDDPGQVVLRVKSGAFVIDRIPSDWIASDYLRDRKPEPYTISFIALNPRRNVRVLAGGAGIVAETAYMTGGIAPNLLGRSTFWTDQAAREARAFTAMAWRTRDADEARRVIDALERLRP